MFGYIVGKDVVEIVGGDGEGYFVIWVVDSECCGEIIDYLCYDVGLVDWVYVGKLYFVVEFYIVEYCFYEVLVIVEIVFYGDWVGIGGVSCCYLMLLYLWDFVFWEEYEDVCLVVVCKGFDGCVIGVVGGGGDDCCVFVVFC